MTDSELKKTRDKIVHGMQISGKKLLAKKKLLGQELVISENGIIKILKAVDIK